VDIVRDYAENKIEKRVFLGIDQLNKVDFLNLVKSNQPIKYVLDDEGVCLSDGITVHPAHWIYTGVL
jgi:hypothetical protein